ncbi:UNVERIFIED_CONTAM: hypothetical protein Sradi_3589300 [Sesamum radiatum]|uniref:Uncharacterized protein n=1 Tax=Sesamum radiatum TaxID=300843 RepID=A0AAW2QHS2_SESRA
MELTSVLGVMVLAKHEKYFGLLIVAGCSKRELFEGLKDRIWHKLHCWSVKKHSQAGQAILVKIVLQMVPTYTMSCFRLSDSLLKDLESNMEDFFWHGGEGSNIHWKAWFKYCNKVRGRNPIS